MGLQIGFMIKPPVFAILGVTLLLLHQPGLAQNAAAACSSLYESHNQIDYGPLKLEAVKGAGVLEVKGKVEQRGIAEACYNIFTEKDHKLLASVKADAKGNFSFENIKPGRYRLVATLKGLCTANIPLLILRRSQHQKRQILVHFQPAGIDTCSYGELI